MQDFDARLKQLGETLRNADRGYLAAYNARKELTELWDQTVEADAAAMATRSRPITADPATTRDIRAEVLDERGRLRILPAAFWESTTPDERGMFGSLTGIYSFPTVELVEHLRTRIGGRTAIEIGAGHGVLAEALGIPATDRRVQEEDEFRTKIKGNVPVSYGDNVIKSHASQAVRRFKPQVVIACWVTHKHENARHTSGGFEHGIDEDDILRNCEQYVFVGNEEVHRHKKIWSRPHTIDYPSIVYSRAINGTREFIATWKGLKTPPLRRKKR